MTRAFACTAEIGRRQCLDGALNLCGEAEPAKWTPVGARELYEEFVKNVGEDF